MTHIQIWNLFIQYKIPLVGRKYPNLKMLKVLTFEALNRLSNSPSWGILQNTSVAPNPQVATPQPDCRGAKTAFVAVIPNRKNELRAGE
jgi:hypothetical protein